MERAEMEKFKACLALAGLREATIPLRLYYLMAQTLPPMAAGRDEHGAYLDVVPGGAVRVRPIYSQESQRFATQEAVEDFIQRSFSDPSLK